MFFLQVFLNSLVIGTQVLFIAIPMSMIYSMSRVVHLALGASATAIVYGLYFGIHHGSILLGIAVAILVGLVLSFLSYILLEPLIRKQQTLLALILSFSLGIVIESLVALLFGSSSKSLVAGILPVFHFANVQITFPGLITLIVGLALSLLFIFLVHSTSFGRKLRGLSENLSSSQSIEIHVSRFRWIIYIVAIFLSGFVGIMTGLNSALTPTMGFRPLILAFLAFLIGGNFRITGVVIASYIITIIPEFLITVSGVQWNFSSSWTMFFVFCIAIILLLIFPRGIFSSKLRKS